jgi:hypothetical protein
VREVSCEPERKREWGKRKGASPLSEEKENKLKRGGSGSGAVTGRERERERRNK